MSSIFYELFSRKPREILFKNYDLGWNIIIQATFFPAFHQPV